MTWMREVWRDPFEARAYVDTGPIQERVYAQHAGIGWIGKNTCVINHSSAPGRSSPKSSAASRSRSIRPRLTSAARARCVSSVPDAGAGGARRARFTRCISYLTIELRGAIAEPLQQRSARSVRCESVRRSARNAVAPASDDPAWQPRPVWDRPAVQTLAAMTDAELGDALQGSPMRRTKISGLRRNLELPPGTRNRRPAADLIPGAGPALGSGAADGLSRRPLLRLMATVHGPRLRRRR